MVKELSKTYDPKEVEKRWYDRWEADGSFHAPDKPAGETYCIVIPPPNVTGALHMGHALNNTLQDILIRWKRMSGIATLWQPGTDHAGIATQNVVERDLLKTEGKRRQEIGREALIERIWKWKGQYGDRILKQLKALGASCDWERTRFTLDDGLSKAVRKCFVKLYDEGLIYRGKYIVNWCPRCHTALADDEVDHEDEKGHLWHIKYPFEDGSGFLIVATTRPETLLGDTAVAVNPKDERYSGLIGKIISLPETNRKIPIVADDFVDASFGSGAVKVTPAHDPNDFQIGQRHNLPSINIMKEDATMNEEAGEKYAGMKALDCREKIIKSLEENNLLEKTEEHDHSVGHCYRCKTTIEPWLSDQWFVKMKPLAKEAIEASKEGLVKFHPDRWNQFYMQWLENARDWCISRQIWWGHQIPVWYCETDECPPIAAMETPDKCPHCGKTNLRQDEDVLDTWFSSALWPFSTLGWPDETEMLKAYYPTSTLVTDRGIIYFWVARMVMMGLKLMGKVPFSDVYIHGTILDEQGRKMSKSLGNGIDPIGIIEKYGSDAMRFSLMVLSTEGQDLKLSESKFEMGRNFCNKLWNASRFAMMNLADYNGETPEENDLSLADKWILNRLQMATNKTLEALDGFHFSNAAQTLYQFVWNDFCDWYLEASKLHMMDKENAKARCAAQHTLKKVLGDTLRLLHPFMPFITEEIWSNLSPKSEILIVTKYPLRSDAPFEKESKLFEITKKEPVEAIRNIRGESNVQQGKRIPLALSSFKSDEIVKNANESARYVEHLAKVDSHKAFRSGNEPEETKKAATNVTDNQTTYIPLAGLIDIDAEKTRLEKEIGKARGELEGVSKKLSNESFTARAPAEIVEREMARKNTIEEKLNKLTDALNKLGS